MFGRNLTKMVLLNFGKFRKTFRSVTLLKMDSFRINFYDARVVWHKLYQWRCSVKKGVFKKFTKLTGKHLCQSLCNCNFILKKILWHRCFTVNCEILKNTFFSEHVPTTAELLSKSVPVQNISKSFFQKFERNFLKEQLPTKSFSEH